MANFKASAQQVESPEYALNYTMGLIAGRWRVSILWQLRRGPVRYGVLHRSLGRISHKVFNEQLKALEAEGIIKRTEYSLKPPAVDYRLTDWGTSLLPLFIAMRTWGKNKLDADKPQGKDAS
jgi:DNA-binding HxlR family transcriptional regulator